MLAVIPAGGRAERFGGIYKELLPIGEHKYLLTEAIKRAADLGATQFLVVTNDRKRPHQQEIVRHHCPGYGVVFMDNGGKAALWEALRPVLALRIDSLLVLPDTIWSCSARIPRQAGLALGLFQTNEPWRFSTVRDGRIHTKDTTLRGRSDAWGVVYWSRDVAHYWRRQEDRNGHYPHYDAAFQAAMDTFGYDRFPLIGYEDLGTWDCYRRVVARRGL